MARETKLFRKSGGQIKKKIVFKNVATLKLTLQMWYNKLACIFSNHIFSWKKLVKRRQREKNNKDNIKKIKCLFIKMLPPICLNRKTLDLILEHSIGSIWFPMILNHEFTEYAISIFYTEILQRQTSRRKKWTVVPVFNSAFLTNLNGLRIGQVGYNIINS